ncbi:MAG: sensor histidine kinase [Acidobacteria bacterium]|nr:MAG: sensor histidine kinase [Acidobacteriota bacterium]
MLHEFVVENRAEIIRRCRLKVAGRTIPPPTPAEIDHGVPMFLDQLVRSLIIGASSREIAESALRHGFDLLHQGFTVSQVVHDYGDICQSVTELAVELNVPISTDDFRTLNRCLDEAIAEAVTEYQREHNQLARDGEAARESERLGFLAHELRNLLNTALFSFEVLKSGKVGVSGSVGMVLHRSLMGLQAISGRALAEIRLTQGVQNPEPFLVSEFINELAQAAALEAQVRDVLLTVAPAEEEAVIDGDRQTLMAVVRNLLQNAFKFTRPGTSVALRVSAGSERVLIEVEDECGGLPGEDVDNVDALFKAFEQRGADRTGVGLGLAFSRWATEANNGRIYARNLPGRGCVFTVDLPREVAVPR